MGRPRQHDHRTSAALLDAAERVVETEGLAGLSVRRIADEAGTTTRAVYSLFGSKDGLVVALGRRAFDWLGETIDALPVLDDPVKDLPEAGVRVFRRLVLERPALFTLGVQQLDVPPELAVEFRSAADAAMARLLVRFRRLTKAGMHDGVTIVDATCEFHALCEGLAMLERRGVMTPGREEWIWRDALHALIVGLTRR